MQPEALNCPNCGAAVSSDHTECEFCKSRLKTVACPSCLGLMFLGNKFCGHCGEAGSDVRNWTRITSRAICPRCKLDLQSLKIDDDEYSRVFAMRRILDECSDFRDLCDDKEQQSAVI